MGYYSNFDGVFKPTKPLTADQSSRIHKWFVERFGDYQYNSDNEVIFPRDPFAEGAKFYKGAIFFSFKDGEGGVVRPTSRNMKGYSFCEHLVEFCNFIKGIAVEYTGDVLRHGEDSEDVELIEIHHGNVYSRKREWQWGNAEHKTESEAEANARMDKKLDAIFASLNN